MLSIFLAFLVHFISPGLAGGAFAHPAAQAPAHHVHIMDSGGGPAD